MPGQPDDITMGPTVAATTPVAKQGPHTPASSRFAPGSIIAGRYRLVALLGRGGMGEVYRADDLTLDHPVALKFLAGEVPLKPVRVRLKPDTTEPDADATDANGNDLNRADDHDARLAQFHNELRVARQVSHKNVCRLYDLGEADGRRFLTMEYVDGEDLASLLRRIGRIPQDKAIEISRQLCAGLAAAHERGVIHRDLKPANVMIDGDGNVRITDFGLAVAGGDAAAVRAGTPQYMAPEQLSGQPATIKTDLYALGLILFEIFTGKRAYDAKTLHDLLRLHESGSLPTPSSVVRDLDPAIERVILRCLERDPAVRPASALAVAAALPGANPLADALAAGETPSPEMLVAAAEALAMPVLPAFAAAAGFIALLLVFAAVSPRASIPGLVPLEKPTDVLADRAEQLIASLGYTDPAVDRARGFTVSADHQRWAQRHGPANWWPVLRSASPPALLFWYRTSPRDLVPTQPASTVTSTDPPSLVSGMRLAIFDTRGRLVEFHSVPPQLDADSTPAPAPNWRTLFEAASLDRAAFAPVTPQWTPREFADTRAAWQGPLPERANLVVRVEAAAYRGRPVSFAVIGDWTQPAQMQAAVRTPLQSALSAIDVAMYLMVLCGAALLARYNLRARRADSQGAARLAIGLTLMETVAWTFGAHHVGTPDIELHQVMSALAFTTYLGAVVWVLYLAIEPYARRFWPDGLLGWTRLLSGRVRDPRVGRDVLIGLLFGIGMIWLEAAGALLPQVWGYTASLPPFGKSVAPLASDVVVLTQWITRVYGALQTALYVAMIFTVLRLLLRRAWMAMVAGILVLLALTDGGRAFTGTWFDTAVQTCTIALAAYATFRHGLLVLAIMVFTDSVATNLPLTLHGSAWWAATSNLTMALFIGLAAFGVYAARAGQPLFGIWNSEFGIRNS